MHILSPEQLSQRVTDIIHGFSMHPPKFIVDSRKNEFPWDRPPLELWPVTETGLLNVNSPSAIVKFDQERMTFLRDKFGEDEALRYKAMNPLRIYVRNNYKVISRREFGSQFVVFQRKETSRN